MYADLSKDKGHCEYWFKILANYLGLQALVVMTLSLLFVRTQAVQGLLKFFGLSGVLGRNRVLYTLAWKDIRFDAYKSV